MHQLCLLRFQCWPQGGTQLTTPRATLLIDTRGQNPFDFSRFGGWFCGCREKGTENRRLFHWRIIRV